MAFMEALSIPLACSISRLSLSPRLTLYTSNNLLSASLSLPRPRGTNRFLIPHASSSSSSSSYRAPPIGQRLKHGAFPVAASAGVVLLCLVIARRHRSALLLFSCFIFPIAFIPLRGYTKPLRDKFMRLERATAWPRFITRIRVLLLSTSDSIDNGPPLSSSINQKLDLVLSDIHTSIGILKNTAATKKISHSHVLYAVDELHKTSESLKGLHKFLISNGSLKLREESIARKSVYNEYEIHADDRRTSSINGRATEIQSVGEKEIQNFQTANIEQASITPDKVAMVNCDEEVATSVKTGEATELDKQDAKLRAESSPLVYRSRNLSETVKTDSIDSVADLSEGNQILGSRSVQPSGLDMDVQTNSTLTHLSSNYTDLRKTSGKDTEEASRTFHLTGAFTKINRMHSGETKVSGEDAFCKEVIDENSPEQGDNRWQSKTDFWQSVEWQESKNHLVSPSSTNMGPTVVSKFRGNNPCGIDKEQIVAIKRDFGVRRDWWSGEGQDVESLDGSSRVSRFQKKRHASSSGSLKDKENGNLSGNKNVLETEEALEKLDYPDKGEPQTRMLENSNLELVTSKAGKQVETGGNTNDETSSEPTTNHGDEQEDKNKTFTEIKTVKSIKIGEEVLFSQPDFQIQETSKTPLYSENQLGTASLNSPLLDGWLSKKEDKEFLRLMDEGEAFLNEAKNGLNGNMEVSLSENKFYDAADRFASAFAINSSSLEAIGLWGNTLLLHGEYKLKLSSKLRKMIVPTATWAYESGLRGVAKEQMKLDSEQAAVLHTLQAVSEECENLLIEAGRKYRKALSINRTDIRALYNWGLALCFRAQLIVSEGAENAAEDADKIYLAAIDKFEAMMGINQTLYALGALLNWGLALRDRSRLRPMGSRDRKKLLRQAKQLFVDALRFDSENIQAKGAIIACNAELKELQAYDELLIRTGRKALKWNWWDQK